jgi:hypothetical protein
MGGSSESSSSQTQQTSTTNQDNRVAAEPGGVALGQGASVNIQDQFSDNVQKAFNELIDLSRQAGAVAVDFSTRAIEANEKALTEVAKRASQAEQTETLGEKRIFTDIFPYVAAAVVAIVAVQIFAKR